MLKAKRNRVRRDGKVNVEDDSGVLGGKYLTGWYGGPDTILMLFHTRVWREDFTSTKGRFAVYLGGKGRVTGAGDLS